MFDPAARDDALGTMALTRLLVRNTGLPVIAAGGIMDGAGIAAVLDLGASAAQLGAAFVACPESAADDAYRAALTGPGAYHTAMTPLISGGRPARSPTASPPSRTRSSAADRPTTPSRMTPAKPSMPLPGRAGSTASAPSGLARERGSPAPCRQQGWLRGCELSFRTAEADSENVRFTPHSGPSGLFHQSEGGRSIAPLSRRSVSSLPIRRLRKQEKQLYAGMSRLAGFKPLASRRMSDADDPSPGALTI